MRRLTVLIILAVMLLAAPLFGVSDTAALVVDTTTPDAGASSVPTEGERPSSNSSATATISITMTTMPNE